MKKSRGETAAGRRIRGLGVGTSHVARVIGVIMAALFALVALPSVAFATQLNVQLWGQNDSRWSSIPLGQGGYNMGSAGCAVTSAAMVANYFGSSKDPGQICQWLNVPANGGFQPGTGNLYWTRIPAAAGGTISYVTKTSYPGIPANMTTIRAELDAGRPVIAGIQGERHWVVITGYSGDTYYVNDPGGPTVPGRSGSFSTWYGSPVANYIDSIIIYHGSHAAPTLPAQALNPRVTSTTSSSATAAWTDASNNEDGFRFQYRLASSTGAFTVASGTAAANATSYTISGLAANTAYTFQVGAYNGAGTKWSAYFNGTTSAQSRSTVIVDDSGAAFYGPASGWRTASVGYGGSMHWTWNATGAVENYAIWRPTLGAGNYQVYAYIPSAKAGATTAHYQIYTGTAMVTATINQEPYADVWVSLGTYNFVAGTAAYVNLADATGEAYATKMVGYDAIEFVPR